MGDTFIQTPVGVFFGEAGKTVPDPYFGGVGPDRTGCIECGECMTGCRHGAKNTLLKNYLGLAEKAGAEIIPMTTVTGLREASDGTWDVFTRRSGPRKNRNRKTYTAANVVLAAGTWGTQHLLFDQKETGALPKISDRLGGTHPHQFGVDPRRRQEQGGPRARAHEGRRHHVVLPPDV